MYKLLLVDDSEFVLDGFREKINLSDLGIELAGVATNGEDALQRILEIDPDILVTDIKMPKMDGMELIEAVRRMGKQVRVVILSGYSDFEYARKAVSLNAMEYLLKPILKSDIENTLRKIVDSLKSQETEVLRQIQLEVQNRQNQEIVKAHIISSLLEGTAENRRQVCEMLATVDRGLLESKAVVALLEPDQAGPVALRSPEEKREAMSGVLATAAAAAGPGCIGVMLNEKRAALVLLYGRSSQDSVIEESCGNTLRAIREAVKTRHGSTVTLSASQAVPDICDIRKCFLQASQAMKYRIIFDNGSIIRQADVLKLQMRDSTRFAASVKSAMEAVEKGVRDDINRAIEAFYSGIAAHRECEPADVISAAYKLALAAGSLQRDRDATISESALWEQLNTMECLEDIRCWVKGIFDGAFAAIEAKGRHSRIVNLVIESVEKNYDKDLLLKNLAKELYISENYLTTLFKKETGTSFKKYMTNVRMRKAMELLRDPQYKVYEIAGLTGYDSEEHFCRMFKESTGVTPKEYRNSCTPARNRQP